MAELGFKSVRYADDIVVMAPSVEVASQAHFDFLGYRFLRTAKGKLIRLVRPKSKKKLRESLRNPTKRANGRSLDAIINPKLRGWFAYFKQAHSSEHEELDRWVRMRLRSILRKRHKGKGRGRGFDHFKWPNRYFEKLGLFSLKRARGEQMSLRKGATC
jgi:RNA-directed DNA polymerase